MARFVAHEPCPACGSKDNLGRFDDGGAFCFGCHYYERATHAPMRHMGSNNQDTHEKYHHPLPEDIGHDYGQAAVEWMARFHLDVPTAIRMGIVWSPSRQQLIFQLGDVWQARNFGEGGGNSNRPRSKNFTSGDVNECLFIYEDRRGPRLVLVEDPVSAIRTALAVPQGASMPLLGSHLATARLNAVAGLYSGPECEVVVWLDSDKLKEARSISDRFNLIDIKSRTIWTELDPKCYSDMEIQKILDL
jgi:hypothetical protein